MQIARESKPELQVALQLHFEDRTTVIVRPDEKNWLLTTVAEAAKACQFAREAAEFRESFDKFLAHVHNWSKTHPETIARTYVAVAPHGLEVFVVTRGADYRFEFDDEVSKLDLELVSTFPECPAHVTHLPDESPETLRSFFSPDKAVQVYGN
jgi:hypothetical protein